MTEYKKRPIEHCKLEAIIFVYLLIIATFCVHNYDNWPLLAIRNGQILIKDCKEYCEVMTVIIALECLAQHMVSRKV